MTKFRSALLVLLLLVLGYTGFWFTASFGMDDRIKDLQKQLGSTGFVLKYQDFSVSGFPYRLTVDFENFQLEGNGGTFSLRAERLALVTHLWTRGHWVGEALNARLALADKSVQLKSPNLQISSRTQGPKGTGIALDFGGEAGAATLEKAPGLRATSPLQQAFIAVRFGGEETNSTLYENTLFDFRIRLGSTEAGLTAVGTVTGGAIQNWSASALESWRDTAGLVEFGEFTLRHRDTSLTATGSLSLDEDRRPLGAFSGTISGSGAPDLLAAFHLTNGTDARAATTLNQMADGAPFEARLQNGRLVIGDTPLAQLPRLP